MKALMLIVILFFSITSAEGADWVTFKLEDIGLSGDRVTTLRQDSEGKVWIGTNAAEIVCWDGQIWEALINEEPSVPAWSWSIRSVSALAVDPSHAVWAIIGGEDSGDLWQYVDGNWFTFRGSIVFSTAKPVASLTGQECWDKRIINVINVTPEITDGVPHIPGDYDYDLIDIAIDHLGHLWATSRSDHVVFRFDGEQISCWNDGLFDGVQQEPVQIAVLPDGDLVLALMESGPAIFRFDGTEWSRRAAPPASIGARLSAAPDGSLWAGAQEGLYRYRNEQWESILTWEPSTIALTQAVQADGDDGVWAIVRMTDERSRLLQVSRQGQVVDWGYPHDTPLNRFFFVGMVFEAARQRLWIGDEKGIHWLDTTSATATLPKTWGQVKAEAK